MNKRWDFRRVPARIRARYALARNKPLDEPTLAEALRDGGATIVIADRAFDRCAVLLHHGRRYPVPVILDAFEGTKSRKLCAMARRIGTPITTWSCLAFVLFHERQRSGMALIPEHLFKAVALAIIQGSKIPTGKSPDDDRREG